MTDPFVAAIEQMLPPDLRAYKMNEVPKEPRPPYAVWSLGDDRPTTYRGDATHGLRFYRLTWQAFGKTLDAARSANTRFSDAVLDRLPVVAGYRCGPMVAGSDSIFGAPTRDPDDGGLVGLTSSLTFTATKEQT